MDAARVSKVCLRHPGYSSRHFQWARQASGLPGRREACVDMPGTGTSMSPRARLVSPARTQQSKQTVCDLFAGGGREAREWRTALRQTFVHRPTLWKRREPSPGSLISFFSTTGRRIERPEEAGRGSPPLRCHKTGVDGGARRRQQARDNVPGADNAVPRVPGLRRDHRAPLLLLPSVPYSPTGAGKRTRTDEEE